MTEAFSRLTRTEQLWWTTAGILLAMFAVTLVAFRLDRRRIDGANIWAKPLKFEISLALHFATLALVVHILSPAWKGSGFLLIVAGLSVLSAVGEMAYILVQAGRRQASHFNLSTPFYAAMYAFMALGALIITASAAAVGGAVALDGQANIAPPVRLGIVLGLTGGTILTIVVGFTMGGRLSRHVGMEPAGAKRMAFTGWSLEVGDFRPPHFFATHMMQVVPLGGFIAARAMPAAGATAAVLALALIWTAVTLALFRQALAGRPYARSRIFRLIDHAGPAAVGGGTAPVHTSPGPVRATDNG